MNRGRSVCVVASCFLAVCLLSGTALAAPLAFQTTGALPNGVPGLPYGTTLQVSGGQGPYTFAITAGSLPAMFTLDGSSNATLPGHISGTPTTVGTSNFTVTVTDSLNSTATGNFSIAINALPTSTAAQLALLNGRYAFLFRGNNQPNNSVDDVAGTLNFDGKGNLSALVDENHSSGVTTQCAQSGTYSVGPDNRGLLHISPTSCSGGGAGLAFALGDVKNGVANTGRFIPFDNNSGNGGLGAGLLRRQDPTAFTAASLAGTYVFGLTGQDSSVLGRAVELALTTFDGSLGITGGSFDLNDNGTLIAGTLSGSYTAPDANGRSVLTVAVAGFGTNTSAIYIVSANEMFLLTLDPTTTSILLAGEGERQFNPNSFGLNSLTGPDILTFSGTSGNGTFAGVGVLTASVVNNVGNFSATIDINDGGTLKLGQTITGTYTAASNGRMLLTGVTSSAGTANLIVYLIRPDRAFFITEDSGNPPFGEIKPQIGAPFSASPFANNLFFGDRELPSTGNSDVTGVAVLAPSNTLNVTTDESHSGGDLNYGQPGSLSYTVDSTGHINLTINDGSILAGYVISPFEVAFFDTTGPTSDPTPSQRPQLFIGQSIPQPPGAPSPATATVTFDGPVVVGSTAQSGPVTETNGGVGPLTIQTLTNAADFTASGSCVTSLPVVLAPGQSCPVVVTFAPGANTPTNTPLNETITIATDAGNFTITARGTAIAPGILINPMVLNFGLQPLNTTSPQSFVTVTNTGQVTLTISTIVPGGTNPGDFAFPVPNVTPPGPPCVNGTVLQPNAICALTAQFTPSAAGARSATITLTDNSPVAGSTQVITLQGTGTVPTISLSTNSINFGGIAPNSTSGPQTITVTNTGLATLTVSNVSLGGTNPGNFSLASGTTCIDTTVQLNASCAVVVTFTPNSTNSFTASVSITSNASNGTQTVTLTGSGAVVSLTPAPGTTTTVTVQPGDTAVFPLILSSNGFTGTVTLGCTSQQPTITCSVAPLTVQVNGNQPVQTAISVQTFCSWMAPLGTLPLGPDGRPAWPASLALLGIASLVFTIATKRERRLGFALATVAVVTLLGAGCASTPKGPAGRTPPGTYTLTITATAQGVTQSLNVTVIVR